MADSTTNLDYGQEYFDTVEAPIKDSEQLVVDGGAAIDPSTGFMENMGDTAGLIPVGLVIGSTDRDNTAAGLTGNSGATRKALSKGGRTLSSVAVIGASALGDFGKLVYMTDNQTFTLTKPTAALPVGWVKKWISSNLCDVQLFTSTESIMWSMIPQKQRIHMGYLSAQSMGGIAAADLLTYTAKNKMQLDTLVAMPQIDDAAVAGGQDLNLKIGTTSVLGTLTLAYTNCDDLADLGTEVSASLSGANTANQGDIITLEMAASGIGFTDNTVAGFNIYLDVTLLPGS